MAKVKIVSKNYAAPPPKRFSPLPEAGRPSLDGKSVLFFRDGKEVAGVVKSQVGTILEIAYAIPDREGRLVASQDALTYESVDNVKEIDLRSTKGHVKRWVSEESIHELGKYTVIKDEAGNIVDYRGVRFEGLASTFGSPDVVDRDKEYIIPGAFDESLNEFRRNPVMLINHDRSVMSLMGHYEKVSLTSEGLSTLGAITDAPGDIAKHVRWSVVEGSLKTQSIGGAFIYADDYRGIRVVDLHEISLVVVPANPKAQMICCRQLDAETAQKSLASRIVAGHLRQK